MVGGGSREHAIVTRLLPDCGRIVAAPGNAGLANDCEIRPLEVSDVGAIVRLAQEIEADLVVIGPELPLALGAVDALADASIAAFGPTKELARLEASKSFMKAFADRHGIPTAEYGAFESADDALAYIDRASFPLVVKADGLASGKGVIVTQSHDEAKEAVRDIMVERRFGGAGDTVVVEERLEGEEASFHVIASGSRYVVLPPAQDHKRIFDGDRGPNTGGMGAYAPAPIVTDRVFDHVCKDIVEPTLRGLEAEGTPFRGTLFIGLMIHAGRAKVLEYNVRFGDPEATVVLSLVGGSFYELLRTAALGTLEPERYPVRRGRAALAVVLASEGYPGTPVTGKRIEGLDAARGEGVHVFHAGTKLNDAGEISTSGGRVLAVSAEADTLSVARDRAYAAADKIRFEGMQRRSDIGARALG